VEERRQYASGLCHGVQYDCILQGKDGTVTRVDAVTMTPRILQLLRENWQMSAEVPPHSNH
jgi:hypothetical protein